MNWRECIIKYGKPTPAFEMQFMMVWDVPDEIHSQILPLPKKIYLNRDMVYPLKNALLKIIISGLADDITEYGGIFNIRYQRNSYPPVYSMHSWGIAIDINMHNNQMGYTPSLNPLLVECFTKNGFDWGGDWAKPRTDGMHFQLSKI